MQSALRSPLLVAILGGVAVTSSVILGIVLRLVDPLSSSVIPAEDPYTHMAYVREHLRTGTLDPLNPPGGMYPPGMHALLAAVWVFSGVELYELIRLGPVFFGALGVLGMGVLLWRYGGPIAAAVGSLGYAIAPEIVFRTTMMAPTALDLALLPFFLFVLIQVTGGSLRWLGVALPFTAFLIFAHPWLFGILGLAGIAFIVLTLLMPWRSTRSPAPTAFGMALVLALTVGGLGISMTGCGGYCGPGLSELLPDSLAGAWLAPLLILGGIAPAALLYRRRGSTLLMPRPDRKGLPLWARAIASGIIAVALLLLAAPALSQGLPDQVNLSRMFGGSILYLAFFGLIALPFLASRAAYLGAALLVPTLPMVLYDLLNNEYWPHRTAVFLGIALVILLGVAAEALVRWAIALSRKAGQLATRRAPAPRGARATGLAAFAAAILVFGSVAGSVYAGTPEPYEWYRLYPECEHEAMHEIGARINAQPLALVLVGSWEAKVVLAALAEDPQRIWLSEEFFLHEEERLDRVAEQRRNHEPIYALVDRHLQGNNPQADFGYFHAEPWQEAGAWCAGLGFAQPRISLYETRGGFA